VDVPSHPIAASYHRVNHPRHEWPSLEPLHGVTGRIGRPLHRHRIRRAAGDRDTRLHHTAGFGSKSIDQHECARESDRLDVGSVYVRRFASSDDHR
jgi:hypothetical protein